jgi:hypothetical protein
MASTAEPRLQLFDLAHLLLELRVQAFELPVERFCFWRWRSARSGSFVAWRSSC